MHAVTLVTGAIASTDHTAPGMWEAARKAEAADDKRWYRNNPTLRRTAPERDAVLVLAVLESDQYTLGTLYGVREAFVKAARRGGSARGCTP
jgi:hypothetical protein